MDQAQGRKWIAVVTLDILICTAILIVISYLHVSDALRNRVAEQAQESADRYAQELGSWLTGYGRIVDTLAAEFETQGLADLPPEELHRHLEQTFLILNQEEQFYDIYFIDPDNHMTCSVDYFSDGQVDYVNSDSFYQDAVKSGRLCYSGPYNDEFENVPVVTIAREIRMDGVLKGVLAADIYVDQIVDQISRADLAEGCYAFLTDRQGGMVAHPDPAYAYDDQPIHMTETGNADYSRVLDMMRSGERHIVYVRDYDQVVRGINISEIPEVGWYVGIATPRSVLAEDASRLILAYLVAAVVAIAVGVLIIILYIAQRMHSHRITASQAYRRVGGRYILAAIVANLFFVAVIVASYLMMSSAIRENITLRGELRALDEAEQLEHYMNQTTDTVKQLRFRIDRMLQDGDSRQEILDYMTEVTVNIQNALDPEFTGVYGVINGEYYDGANWIPDEDYEPTERPWYIGAMEEPGKVVYIEPYVDAQTGQMMMTVAQTLEEGNGVVALDITIDMMRRITASRDAADEDRMEMILDDHGLVVIHTREDQIGHNYLEEKDSLGASIAAKLYATQDPFFEMRYEGEEYLVYALAINEQWYSVAVIDVGSRYRPLRYLTFVTICAIALIIVALLIIFLTMGAKTLAAERLSRQLSATADIYVSAHDIDVIHDRYLQIHADTYVSGFLSAGYKNAQKTLNEVMRQTTAKGSIENVLAFVDLRTLKERLGESNTITLEFLGISGRWCRGRFVVSEYTPRGEISRVLWLVENIDQEKKRRDELQDLSARAIAQSEAQNAFLARMSHEIRTPINAMIGMNEMIRRETTDVNIADYAETIRAAGTELLHMVDDLLSYSRRGEGEMELISEDYEKSCRDNDGTVRNYLAGIRAPEADILLVDDTQVNLMVAKNLLKRTGVRADTAVNGEEGLAFAAKKKYDLIFLDQMMPGKDGTETLRELRAGGGLNAGTPVVCLTANVVAGAREQYLADGFDDYLSKPIDPEALEGMLTKFLPKDKIIICENMPSEGKPADRGTMSEWKLNGIDTEQGIEYCGSEEAYEQVLRVYYEGIEDKSASLERLYAQSDWRNYAIEVHSLKSSSRVIGALDLADRAQAVEDAAKAEDETFLRAHHSDLLSDYRSFREILREAVTDISDDAGEIRQLPEAEETVAEEIFRRIREAADAMDIDGIEAALKEASRYRFRGEDGKRLDEIRKRAESFDYEEISSILRDS